MFHIILLKLRSGQPIATLITIISRSSGNIIIWGGEKNLHSVVGEDPVVAGKKERPSLPIAAIDNSIRYLEPSVLQYLRVLKR